jgi:hypothetical protein
MFVRTLGSDFALVHLDPAVLDAELTSRDRERCSNSGIASGSGTLEVRANGRLYEFRAGRKFEWAYTMVPSR